VELMVIVTPTIVDPLNHPVVPTPPQLPVPTLDPKQFDKKTGKQTRATQPGTGSTP
jgi:Flp pilus assembly secretin CpaC